METIKKEDILISWVCWHFYEMPRFLFKVWINYFVFATNIFSILLLLKTFFSPWRKYNWRYPKNFNIQAFFETLSSNVISRVLGAIMRTGLIIIGILFQIIVTIIGALILIGWFFIPLVIVFGFLFILIY